MGWLFVCFDLPVEDKEERRLAANFRKDLLNLGYFMLQNSIYVRSCVTYEKTDKFIKNLKDIAPATGSINIFFLTDKQWSLSVCIEKINYKNSKYIQKIGENAPKQMTFW
ncbi:CRISPR-associated endonuclease Cas2 [bacterium]|nr:CRISPR-associated endonuclease Cas2 [bacterium]